jgi:hypothetical protein
LGFLEDRKITGKYVLSILRYAVGNCLQFISQISPSAP